MRSCDTISPQAGYYKRTGHNEISQYVSKVTVMSLCDSHVILLTQDLEDIMLINIIKDTQVSGHYGYVVMVTDGIM